MANVASSSQTPIVIRPRGIVQLNDSVWELYNPSSIAPVPEVEVVFFHGLQLDHYEEAFWRTWLSRDNTVVWPRDWLSERFPKARILSISYGSSLLRRQGEPDPYVITENLIDDMIQSDGIHVGQNCPVVLVGHSFGGIVIKQFVLGCIRMKEELNHGTCQLEVDRINNFLRNCRGVFYYSTPHLGSRIADYADRIPGIKFNVPLMKLLKTLSTETGRINERFAHARHNFGGIKTRAMGESLNTNYMGLSAKVVEDASARYDNDVGFYTAPNANHFNICKPKDSKTCGIFKQLARFVGDIVESNETTVGKNGDECQGLPNYPVELDSRARDIEKLLLGKAVIGISGMGGIGKTTLAKKVYNNISKNFDYTCFAENVKDMQVRDLEDWLLCHFHKSGTRMEGQRQWSDFKERKTMIVLDDVDSANQISVVPKLHHFGKGSCIILTSRDGGGDGGIFKCFDKFELYEVKFLKDDEAKELFCQHAFGRQGIPNDATNLKENVEAVVEKCNGLPLTLEVIGCYLRNENNAKVWKETIDKLRRAKSIDGGQNDRVWASLRVSYEALAKEEQAMFIEAGTYFFGKQLEVALAAWSATRENPESTWKNLVTRSMVKENQDKTVWVHEHLRALSSTLTKDIVSSSDEKVDKVTGVDELVRQLNAKQVNAGTKILRLKCPHLDRTLNLQRIAELKELKYLDLDEVETKGSGKNLSRTLSLLRWKRRVRSKSHLPITLIPMTSLAVLELEYGDVPKGFPEALSNLTNLRYLSLSWLEGLDHLPENFGKLSHLKYLYLVGLNLSSLPKSFGNLADLECLELSFLDVFELPDSFGSLSSVVSLKISDCKNLVSLPSSFGNLSSLVSLEIIDCRKLVCLPSSFGRKLMALEELSIKSCSSLECLSDSFSQLPSLRQLSLNWCRGLKELGASFGNLSALKDLDLSYTSIRRLPSSFSQLSGLERLSLSNCESLMELGDSFGNLSALKDLDLSYTGIRRHWRALEDLDLERIGIERLPDSFSQLLGLERLSLHNCESLKELGDSFGNLPALKDLDLAGTHIGRLPESFGCLYALEKLSCKFDQARLLPDNFRLLKSLRELSIKSPSLERLPDSLGELVSLEKLSLDVDNVSALPTSMGQLASLRNLHIFSQKLEKLPDSFEKLSSLEKLIVFAKTSVGILSSIGPVSSLQTLHVSEFSEFKELDWYDSAESGDEKLDCDDSVEKLRDLFGKLCSLREMDIDCGNLKELPDSLEKLSSLERLTIVGRKLESLPQSIGQLCSLRTMELEVPRIRCLPESMNKLSSLRKFSFKCAGHGRLPDHFEHLPFPSPAVELQGSWWVPEGIGRLSSLQDLTLLLFDVRSLPEELGELSSLRELHLEYCKRLESLPDSLGRPSSSQRALPHGAVRNDEEPSSETPAAGANASELTVYIYECPILDELRMRSLGWVPCEGSEYFLGLAYRRMPDNVRDDVSDNICLRANKKMKKENKVSDNIPLGCVVVQSTRALCYITIFSYLLRKFYYAFLHK